MKGRLLLIAAVACLLAPVAVAMPAAATHPCWGGPTCVHPWDPLCLLAQKRPELRSYVDSICPGWW